MNFAYQPDERHDFYNSLATMHVVLSFNQVDLIIRLEPVPAGVWQRTVAALVMSALGIFAGTSLWLETGGGLLWNVLGNLVGLTIALFNAWKCHVRARDARFGPGR